MEAKDGEHIADQAMAVMKHMKETMDIPYDQAGPVCALILAVLNEVERRESISHEFQLASGVEFRVTTDRLIT